MVFSSHLFIFYFLPLVLLLNYTLPFRFLSLMLVCLSYAFYGWMNPKWVLLMFTSSFIDYFCGLILVKASGLPNEGQELPLRPGDTPELVAAPSRARDVLGWSCQYPDIETIVRHAWAWHQKHR